MLQFFKIIPRNLHILNERKIEISQTIQQQTTEFLHFLNMHVQVVNKIIIKHGRCGQYKKYDNSKRPFENVLLFDL
jgi:hypothetical protein